MKDYVEVVSGHLRERLSSPLMASFLLSWPVWNYKFILVVFSKNGPAEKISYISSQVYPELWHGLFFGLCGPILTACFYVGVYPFAVYGAEYISNLHRVRLEKQRLKNLDERPLGEEEARSLRHQLRMSLRSVENEIDQQAEVIKKLRTELSASEGKITDMVTAESRLKEQLAASEISLRVQGERYHKLEGRYSDLQALLEVESSSRENLSRENESLELQLDKITDERNSLQEAFDTSRQNEKRIAKRLTVYMNSFSSGKKAMEALKNDNGALLEENSRLKKLLSEAEE
ncbi:hypothetical protein [Ectopseudomonas toyotomiensis]|uniref:hypothetical protein n=1 Tax=Ectopseudomonas toyotomiensis TaxID=554344 RepID=UPI003D11E13A